MTRTQIQLPDALYDRAKRVAAAKEISLAELTRRGLELLLDQYPAPEEREPSWSLPLIEGMGWNGCSLDEIKDAAQKSSFEEELEAAVRSHAGG